MMKAKGKIHLAIIDIHDEGIDLLESEEKSIDEIARFYEYHQTLEIEHERLAKENEFLKNRLESGTIRNEQMLSGLTQICTAIGVYDSKANTLNFEPILKPYFEKMLSDYLKGQKKRGRLYRRWELLKARAGVDAKSGMLNAGFGIAKFLFNKLVKEKK